MKFKLKPLLVGFVCASFSLSSLALQSPQPQEESKDENIERITVYGTKSLRELNKEIQKTTKAFFKDYNAINDDNLYNVICKKEKRGGSNFRVTTCEPRFVKINRSNQIATRAFGNNGANLGGVDLNPETGSGGVTQSLALSRLALLAGVNRVPPAQSKKFDEHVNKLMKKHPELVEKFQAIIELQKEYAFKKANR